MSEAAEASSPPPPGLVPGEIPLWKMADVKGLIIRHLVTGYLVTSYRCFIWDVEKDAVTVNVPITLAEVTVERKWQGKRQGNREAGQEDLRQGRQEQEELRDRELTAPQPTST